jgi:AmmeMemoRadiSam system protein A
MDIYVELAQRTIEMYVKDQEIPELESVPLELRTKRAGCFVSIHRKDSALRGCIGTIRPVYKNLAGEIIANAAAAATEDTRFAPVKENELEDLVVSVDVLNSPEPIASEKDLDIKKYGVIAQSADGHEGLILPDIDGVNSVKEQIIIAKEKAGLTPDGKVLLYRFTVKRHS